MTLIRVPNSWQRDRARNADDKQPFDFLRKNIME